MKDAATAWAQGVVSGRIVSGELMRLACERHLRDLDTGSARGLRWDAEAAATACEFFPAVFSVTAGASAGQPFYLPSYLTFVVGSLFGWYRESGRLRFREAWLELAKGQVKTPLSAAIGLYVMGWRLQKGQSVSRSEVYAVAKDRNQANVLFGDAVALCRAAIPDFGNQSLESRGDVVIRGTGEMSWLIEHPATGSKFRALANDEKISGPRPTMVAADEIHEWSSTAQIELWKAALTKMPGDGLLMLTTNTPAADQVIATELSEHYQGILRGLFMDDSAFALIARVDAADDPMNDETCWPKALPLLDITFPKENVRVAVNASKHRMATSLATRRLYFGVPVGASEYWIDLDAWEAVQDEVDSDELVGLPCNLALDLSLKNDLTALGAIWTLPDGKLKTKIWYWRPDHALADASRADGAQYVEWANSGYLNLIHGRTVEYEFVASKVQELCSTHTVGAMAFDAAHAGEFRKACDRIGFPTWIWKEGEIPGTGLKMVIHAQGRMGMHSKQMLWMPRSMQQLEDAILKNEITIDRSPLTTWCSSNVATQQDAQGNKWPIKRRQRGRIDGVTVLAMCAGIASVKQEVGRKPEFQLFAFGS